MPIHIFIEQYKTIHVHALYLFEYFIMNYIYVHKEYIKRVGTEVKFLRSWNINPKVWIYPRWKICSNFLFKETNEQVIPSERKEKKRKQKETKMEKKRRKRRRKKKIKNKKLCPSYMIISGFTSFHACMYVCTKTFKVNYLWQNERINFHFGKRDCEICKMKSP